ncbi:MAG TPA: MFS transporter [Amycolatopsis sp.]|uniref:MFS transporter n=1 Tax=Amycolatopsis sp. TaxID=37632 RepID=UPI002B467181|nr:MFS transporter [Amycolatopsis sp.]HKS47171.1 MFS transporter [Amycolatopsis sp.]
MPQPGWDAMMSVTAGRRVLGGNRDFLLLWSGAGLSFLASQVTASAYSLIVLWTTGSVPAAGVVAFAAELPYFVMQLPAGLVADRFDRRRLMVLCDLGRVLAVGSIFTAMLLGHFLLSQLVVVAFVEGSLSVLYRVAEAAAVPSVVPPELLSRAAARNEARAQAAGVLGRPGAGLLATAAQWAPFVFTAVAHVVSLGTLLLIRSELQEPRGGERQRVFAELAAGLRWLWRQKFARAAVGLIAVSNLLFQTLVLAMLVIVRADGGSEAVASLVSTVAGAGGLLGAVSAPWWLRRVSLPVLVIGANAVWTMLVPLMAFVRDPVGLGGIFGAAAFVGAGWTVAVTAYLIQIVPDELRGRVTSVGALIAYGPAAFGHLLGGGMLNLLGVPATVLSVSGVMLLLTVVAVVSPGVRNPRSPDLPPMEQDECRERMRR